MACGDKRGPRACTGGPFFFLELLACSALRCARSWVGHGAYNGSHGSTPWAQRRCRSRVEWTCLAGFARHAVVRPGRDFATRKRWNAVWIPRQRWSTAEREAALTRDGTAATPFFLPLVAKREWRLQMKLVVLLVGCLVALAAAQPPVPGTATVVIDFRGFSSDVSVSVCSVRFATRKAQCLQR